MKMIFFLSLIVLSANLVFGQVSNNTDFFIPKVFVDELRNPNLEGDVEIEGTPFLDSTFIPGKFQIRNTQYLLPMRYNIFLEAFEVKIEDNYLYINSNIVDSVFCNNSTFVFKKIGYCHHVFEILLNSPRGGVYKKSSVMLVDGSFGVPFKADIYPHYKSLNPEYYYSINNEGLIKISTFNDVYNSFPEKKVQIKEFIKKQKLKKDKEHDIIRLFQFVSEL